jgi:hypothetical protein
MLQNIQLHHIAQLQSKTIASKVANTLKLRASHSVAKDLNIQNKFEEYEMSEPCSVNCLQYNMYHETHLYYCPKNTALSYAESYRQLQGSSQAIVNVTAR